MYAVISCSLNPHSRSAILAKQAFEMLEMQHLPVQWIDLREYTLPLCNGWGQSAYDDPQVQKLHDLLLPVQRIIIASPIHNWGIAAGTKNLIELLGTPCRETLTGNVFRNKIIGFIGAVGTPNSFLAPLHFLNSLYVDFQSLIVPSYVLGSLNDFKEDIPSPAIVSRIKILVEKLQALTYLENA